MECIPRSSPTIKVLSTYSLKRVLNLRQTRLLEFLEGYDVHSYYDLKKANIAISALNNGLSTLNHLLPITIELCKDFKMLDINVIVRKGNSLLVTMEV